MHRLHNQIRRTRIITRYTMSTSSRLGIQDQWYTTSSGRICWLSYLPPWSNLSLGSRILDSDLLQTSRLQRLGRLVFRSRSQTVGLQDHHVHIRVYRDRDTRCCLLQLRWCKRWLWRNDNFQATIPTKHCCISLHHLCCQSPSLCDQLSSDTSLQAHLCCTSSTLSSSTSCI